MAVDRDDAVGVLVDDHAVRIHAEGPHQVLEFLGAVDDLALIELVRQLGKDLGRELHAHADVHAVGMRRDAQRAADGFHPLAAASAHGDHAGGAVKALLSRQDAKAVLALFHGRHSRVEEEIDLAAELVVQVFEHDVVDVRAQMPHLRVEQVQAVFQTLSFQLRIRRGVELRPLAAVGEIDLVDIAHQLDGLALADVLVERAAELVGDVVLAVGKGARAAEAAHDAAHRALHAAFHLAAVDRAFAFLERAAQLQHRDLQSSVGLCELVGGENAARPRADHHNVVLHMFHSRNELKKKNPPRSPAGIRTAEKKFLA